jgi:MFS family permease
MNQTSDRLSAHLGRSRRASWSPAPWFTLVVVILATLLTSLDRNVLVLYGDAVAKALALSDTQLGMLQGVGISLLASLVAIPIGWLADRHDHRGVLVLCLCVWAVATLRGATTNQYAVLFTCTIAMGLGDAGFSPIVYSLIPRIFSEKHRFLANSIYAVANLLGLGAGVALAGGLGILGRSLLASSAIAAGRADWQLALLVAAALAVPVIVLVCVMQVGVSSRVDARAPAATRIGLGGYLRRHGKTVVVVYGSFGLGSLGISAVSIWLPLLLGREYGIPAESVGNSMAAVYLAGIALGAAAGSVGVRLLRRIAGPATPIFTVAIGCGLGALASLGLVVADTPFQVYALFGALVTAAVSGVVLAPTIMQQMTSASIRSSVMAAGSMVSTMITALSGPCVGLLSDTLHGQPHGLRLAVVSIGAGAFILAVLLLTWIASSYVRTVQDNADPAAA